MFILKFKDGLLEIKGHKSFKLKKKKNTVWSIAYTIIRKLKTNFNNKIS